jgi:glycosyltransferase involved in cell wall biosynthesis
MKLLFVTGSLVHGGAERHTITLANRISERGHECHFAYVKNDPSQLDRLQLRSPGAVQCLEAARYLDTRAVKRLGALIATLRPSAIVASNPYALMYASLGGRLSAHRAPIMTTFHSNRMLNNKEHLQLLLYRLFFWASDCAVFVCEAQRKYWRRQQVFGRRNEVIYNGVDTELWREWGSDERGALRRALGFADDDFVIGMSAVLRPEKNPLQLVDAVAMLRRRGIPARALMIGDGEMRGAIEERARRLGVAGHVAITGLQREVRPFVAACDAAVLCSFTEALSLAAIEAMALGKPVVHSEVGGAAELVRPGRNGFLFPVGDTSALVERLAQLSEPAVCTRMGARARAAVETHFSERAMVDRYEKTLMELDTARSKHANVRRTAGAH